MNQDVKTTSKQDIENYRKNLAVCLDLANQLITTIGKIKIGIQLGLSQNCSELGKKAEFMVDARDKLIPKYAFAVANIFNALRLLNKKMEQTHEDYERELGGFDTEQN